MICFSVKLQFETEQNEKSELTATAAILAKLQRQNKRGKSQFSQLFSMYCNVKHLVHSVSVHVCCTLISRQLQTQIERKGVIPVFANQSEAVC